jgi:hypothetical protein
LAGIERSGPTQGDYFKKEKKILGSKRKNSIPKKAIFLIFAKKISGSGSSCRPEFRACDLTVPEFFKAEVIQCRQHRLECGDLIVLANVCSEGELACGPTEANDRRIKPAMLSGRDRSPRTVKWFNEQKGYGFI